MNDFANKDVLIRADGRVMHPLLLLQVKAPSDSKHQYDFYKLLGSTPGEGLSATWRGWLRPALSATVDDAGLSRLEAAWHVGGLGRSGLQ